MKNKYYLKFFLILFLIMLGLMVFGIQKKASAAYVSDCSWIATCELTCDPGWGCPCAGDCGSTDDDGCVGTVGVNGYVANEANCGPPDWCGRTGWGINWGTHESWVFHSESLCGSVYWCDNGPQPYLKKCSYISSVNSWGACSGGVQTATSVNWNTIAGESCSDVATTRACPPTIDNVTISSSSVIADGATPYTVNVIASNSTGGNSIADEYALINYQGSNAGAYRGYFGWSIDSSFPYWGGSFKSAPISCSGGGVGAIYNASYGPTYINLLSCSTSISGNTRTASFVVSFNSNFTTPLTNNTLSGWAQNNSGLFDGWSAFNTFNLTFAPTLTFSASPNPVNYDTPATLTWTTANATSCTATGDWTGSKTPGDNKTESTGNIIAAKTYNLECLSGSGVSSGVKTVTVTVPPPPSNPSYTCAGDGKSATIFWTKAIGYNQAYLRTRNQDGTVYYDDNAYVPSNYLLANINPDRNYTWWVHTKDPINGAYSNTVGGTFSCVPAPTLTFNAVPPNISKNNSSTLTWTSADATSCWASGDWTGWKTPGANMTESTGSLDSDKTYNLECWNSLDPAVSTGIMTATVDVATCVPPQGQSSNSVLCVFDGDLDLAADTNIQNFDGDSACNGKCEYKCQDPTAKVANNCNPPKDGVCENDAMRKAYCQKPTANLCDTGDAINIHLNGDRWEWKCSGENGGGESGDCSAVKSCSFKEVAPN